MVDVTDATFEEAVLKRSFEVPVVVDLWAPWCEPCKALGPMLEQAVVESGGDVELAKVNVDENPSVSASFRVQSIPAVFAVRDGAVVDQFIGAQPEAEVRAFVDRSGPGPVRGRPAGHGRGRRRGRGAAAPSVATRAGPPGSRARAGRPAHRPGRHGRGGHAAGPGPETPDVRRLLAAARLAEREDIAGADVGTLLDGLLDRVKDDPDARQEFLDLLKTLGPDDPRTLQYRKALASRLF